MFVRIHFVDGQEERLAGAGEQARKFAIGTSDLGAGVNDHDDGGGFFKGDFGLTKDFGGDEIFVVRNDAAGVDDTELVAAPFGFCVETVAGDTGLVADDGAAGSGEAIEERGFADVGASDDGDEGK